MVRHPRHVVHHREVFTHGKDLGDSHRQLGTTCGLSYQIDYFGPVVADAKSHPERHVTMDVNTRAMKQEYDRLKQSNPTFATAMRSLEAERALESKDDDASSLINRVIELQLAGDGRQSELAGTLCRGIMTLVMRKSVEGGGEMDPVVLDFRNRHLAAQLVNDTRPKIYVTYGAGHLPGVMDIMKRESGWKVESVKWMRTIAAPEHLEGSL